MRGDFRRMPQSAPCQSGLRFVCAEWQRLFASTVDGCPYLHSVPARQHGPHIPAHETHIRTHMFDLCKWGVCCRSGQGMRDRHCRPWPMSEYTTSCAGRLRALCSGRNGNPVILLGICASSPAHSSMANGLCVAGPIQREGLCSRVMPAQHSGYCCDATAKLPVSPRKRWPSEPDFPPAQSAI